MTALILPANDPASIARASESLRAGGLVAMPTETVYGLACDASNSEAIARLYKAKGRPRFNPLIAHITGIDMAKKLALFSPLAEKLADAFWPGPLTLVLPKQAGAPLSDLANAGLETVALRMPRHDAAQALLQVFGAPLVAPSANRSGRISPTTADHVADGLSERIDMILDGGPCPVGLESTVIAVEGDQATLLRPGGLDRFKIETITGPLAQAGKTNSPASPGMLKSHYAPATPVRLNVSQPDTGDAYLGFGDMACDLNLSETGDLVEAAARLFAALRELDARQPNAIAIAPIPDEGLGEAINDRLKRAATPPDPTETP